MPGRAPPALIQETPWLITTLTRIELEMEQLTKDIGTLSAKVDVVDKVVSRCAAKARK